MRYKYQQVLQEQEEEDTSLTESVKAFMHFSVAAAGKFTWSGELSAMNFS